MVTVSFAYGMIMALITLLGPGFVSQQVEGPAADLLLMMVMHSALVSMTSIWASHAYRLATVNACLFLLSAKILLEDTTPMRC